MASLYLLKLSGLNSIDSKINIKQLLFLGRLITGSRAKSYFDSNMSSTGVFQIFARLYKNMICLTISNCGLKLLFFLCTLVESNCEAKGS